MSDSRNWGGGAWVGKIQWPTETAVKFYDLAVRYEDGMTRHLAHPPYSYELIKDHHQDPYPNGISTAMESVTLGTHVGTHVDAPNHISLNGCIFGTRSVIEREPEQSGIEAGSVEEVPPLIGPGHLVDGEVILGREMTNEDGFGAAELDAWFADKPMPGPGSIVLFRTGWMKFWKDSPRYLGSKTGVPGVSISGGRWLSERGVLAVGSDTVNFEHKQFVSVVALDVHVHLLVEHGIPIMESVNLENIAADRVYEFFFTATPLRIGGSTGSPVRPLAIVPAVRRGAA